MKTVRTSTLLNNAQSGFALLPVAVALAVVASIVLLINYQGASSVNRVASDFEANQAHYIAQAGLQHALWQAQNSKCTGDVTIPTTALGSNNYNATSTGGGTSTAYTLSVDQDAWIRSDDITINNGGNADLHIRFESGNVEQPLVRFDLSTLPANAQINSAALWFYIESGKEHPEGPVSIHKIIADWTEGGVTWDSFNASFDNTAIGMIAPQADSDVWVQVNVTAQVQAWVNGEPNYGVLLNSVAEGVHAEYVSSEGVSAQHPRLEVIVGTSTLTPLTLDVTGTLSNGVVRTLNRNNVRELQPPNAMMQQPGPAESDDAEIWDQAPNNNYGDSAETWVSSASNDTTRSLLRFNMGASAIPAGARILEATLSLQRQSGTGADQPVSAHRITNPWSEDDVTWNSRETGTNWDTAGGDFDNMAVATTPVGPGNQRYEWDINPLVQGWVDGSYPNYGVALIAGISGMTGHRFYTSDHADPSLWPSLTITYTCKCGTACLSPQGSGNVLMVIGNSPFFPSNHEKEIRDYIESWGYSVTFIQDDDSQGNFDSQAATHDVVYVSETVSSANVGTKLTNLSIGVVNEQGNLNDELGMASGKANPIGTSVNIVDNSHYITYPFQSGSLEIFSKDMEGLTVSGTEAPGLQTLADWSGTGSLVVLNKGMQTTSGGTTAGRRVMLPLGRSTNSNFNWDYLNNNGRLLVQRSLQWGTENLFTPTINLLMVVVNPNNLTTQEAAKKTLLESWDYNVNLIDESDNQTAFDDAVAVNKVVFITEDVQASTVNTKLVNATIGVVTEEANLADEFGFSETIFWGSGTTIKTEGTHYIVEPLSAGIFTILTTSESLAGLTGARAPDLQIVAETPAGIGPAALDSGAALINGGVSAGRRVFLPWGGNNMNVNHLTDDGLTILQRALEWGASTSDDATSPIAHWKLDDGTGLTAVDSEGGHDGTLTSGPVWVAGQLGNALDFDGTDDYVDLTSDAELDDVFVGGATVMAWIEPASWGGNGYGRVFDKSSSASSTGDGWAIRLNTDNGGLNFGQGFTGGRGWWRFAESSINLGTWQHIAVAYDASSTANDPIVYLNGSLVTATRVDNPSGDVRSDAAINLRLGAHATGSAQTFDGKIDDARIYDRMLNATEIADIAAGGGGGIYTVLMVVSDPKSPGQAAADRKALMESWGYTVTVIDNDDTAANFVAAIDVADMVYIGSGTSPTDVLTKVVVNSAKGVVNEPVGLASTVGFASSWTPVSFDQLTIVDSSHSITQGLVSPFTVFTSSLVATELSGSLSPDLQNLAGAAFAAPAIAVLESGATRHDVGITSGRRAQLPFASAIGSDLTADGQLIVRRAIEWAAGSGGGGGGPTSTCAADDFETDDYTGNTGDFNWNGNWVEVHENTDPNNGDEQVVILDGGNHVARVRDNDSGGEGILRSVDLSTFTSATLNFNYWRGGLDNSNDYVSVQVWPNASDEWEEVLRIEGPGTDDAGSPQSASHDISAFIMNDTHIRFITSPNMGSNDSVYFDNIEVCGQ